MRAETSTLCIVGLAMVATMSLAVPALAQVEPAFGPEPLVRKLFPRLRIEQDSFDWGSRSQGEVVTHRFTLTNPGTGTLKIRRVVPGCGCATAEAVESIPPQGTGVVTLEIDTSRLRGHVQKSATIYTNDPELPKTKVTLTGEVQSLVACSPENPSVSVLAGETTALELTLFPGTEESIEIEEVRCRFKNFDVGALDHVGPGATYRVPLELRPSERAVRKKETLEVKARLESGEVRRIEIPITVEHRDRIEILPGKRVQFTRRETNRLLTDPDQPLVHEVIIRATPEGGEFQIQEIRRLKLPEEHVDVRLETVQEGQEYKLIVELKDYYRERAFLSGKVALVTDLPGQPIRHVHVLARFSRPRSGGD